MLTAFLSLEKNVQLSCANGNMHLFLMQFSPSMHVIGIYMMCASPRECHMT